MQTYYRVAQSNRDQKTDTSMHCPLPLDDLLGQYFTDEAWDELIRYGSDEEKLEALNDHLEYYEFYQSEDEGHLGEGLYLAGVCACSSLEELETYFNDRGGFPTDAGCAIFEIQGEYLDTLFDCELIRVHDYKILKTL